MDDLEKALIEKYGINTIPSEEIRKIMQEAARKNLIEAKDIRPLHPMKGSELFEHISQLRRNFLVGDDKFHFDAQDEEPYKESSRMMYRASKNKFSGDSCDGVFFENSREMPCFKDTHESNSSSSREVMDKVLKAYFEYEKKRTVKKRSWMKSYLFYFGVVGCIFIVVLGILLYTYTPVPY